MSGAARFAVTIAACLEATGIARTRTSGPNEAATSAVSSVQPLATTITFSSSEVWPGRTCASRRPITRLSLCAGITIVGTPQNYGLRSGNQLRVLQYFGICFTFAGQYFGNFRFWADMESCALHA